MSRICIAVLAAVMPLTPLAAQDATPGHDFFIRGGLFFPKMNTTLRVDPVAGTGTGSVLSFERDLDFNDRPLVGFGEAGWRFSEHWRVAFEFIGLNRGQTATIDRDIVVGDTTYPVNGSLTGNFKSNIYKIQVGYSPVLTENAELGVSLGAHLTDFATSLEGQATIAGGGSGGIKTETRSILAPLPNIGAYGRLKLFGPVSLTGRVNWLQLKIDNYNGGLTDAELGLSWRFANSFSATASWRVLNYRLDVERERFEGRIRYRFTGPTVGLVATF